MRINGMVTDSSIIRATPPLHSGNIHKHLDAIVSMGPRWPSTPAERFSAAYMEEIMSQYADEVVSELFDYPLYVPLEADIEVVSDGGKRCNAFGVQYSANGECKGELVYVEGGEGANSRTSSPALENKILLVRTRRPYVLAASL